jgi:hypothetical protein
MALMAILIPDANWRLDRQDTGIVRRPAICRNAIDLAALMNDPLKSGLHGY